VKGKTIFLVIFVSKAVPDQTGSFAKFVIPNKIGQAASTIFFPNTTTTMAFRDFQHSLGKLTSEVKSQIAKNNPLQNEETKKISMWIFQVQ
jgi:hypothetical protein